MSSSTQESGAANGDASQKRYKGVRRRKWGKWVSEIRVPGTQERLWLGSYNNPEAAAVAHDVAFYCLRGNSSPKNLNFPLMLPSNARVGMPPGSVQQAASDAGLAVDAQLLDSKNDEVPREEDGKKVDCSEAEEQSRRRPDGAASWGSETSDWWPRTDAQYFSVSVEDYLWS